LSGPDIPFWCFDPCTPGNHEFDRLTVPVLAGYPIQELWAFERLDSGRPPDTENTDFDFGRPFDASMSTRVIPCAWTLAIFALHRAIREWAADRKRLRREVLAGVDRQSRGAPEIGINLGAQFGHPAVEMLNLEKDCELIGKL
jgi:hypothetical protein